MSDSSHTGPAPATVVVTAGRPPAGPNQPMNVPVVLTSTYTASDFALQPGDLGYGRWSNPTWTALEETLGTLEGGRGLAFASGMAAISAVLGLVPQGGTVVIPDAPYSGTAQLAGELARTGRLGVRAVPVADTAAVVAALDGADLIVLESPTNPLMDVADLRAILAAARERDVLTAVDNTFATPLLQQPLSLGAHLVVHSATKYLSGHSDVLLGIVVTETGEDDELFGRLHGHRTLNGAIPGPMEAWLALRGVRTLALRVERASANAAELARRLTTHPAVSRVRYPGLPGDPGHELARSQMRGFGAMLSFELRGDAEQAERVGAAARLWVNATSLGGVESTLERRRRQSAESPLVPESLIRLSTGIEDVEDLWADLSQALDAAVKKD
ncbi:aminotransferase class I/II-fold pyridoxal phosphate-dependent enzyme [Kineosporia sp. J2-2]|uniref:Aminotransferase class I/II-fold pyridoxal phosphate-dependent enzyme n=1 Tax=Kineosporia corallincola TaxID=2835133 RepID=A0ABS5TFB1_9ACTN|nr:aminotransferase class I/II-fold pyridoxal phosphate-dependent enzyme [Kineosporia corallincola]MBT0769770.1 aminotransferase class I/II-fold pyridoxal phosphate-dependent enzyme [Kineosporia corallincola]